MLICIVACNACTQPVAPTGPLCAEMAARCGGIDAANWQAWCDSECVPEHARTVRCAANAACLLCDAPRDDGQSILFGLPSDLEYLWTYDMGSEVGSDPAL